MSRSSHLSLLGVYIFSSLTLLGDLELDVPLLFESDAITTLTFFSTEAAFIDQNKTHIENEGGYAYYLPTMIRPCVNGEIYSNLLLQ